MSSRETILASVLQNQPSPSPLPDLSIFGIEESDKIRKYMDTFVSVGGKAFLVRSITEIKALIREHFTSGRIVTTLPELADTAERCDPSTDPHTLENVELAVIPAALAVAENGAVWVTEQEMGQRILPYICQHLAVVLDAQRIVLTLHDAYARTATDDYGFGGFIGGPSKTADIEQALVLGAHGPLTMTVFILDQDASATE